MAEIRVIGCMDHTIDHTLESANRVYDVDGIAPTIPCCCGGGQQPKIMEIMKENFRDIVGFENLYSVSDTGQIFSKKKNAFLKPMDDGHGYLRVDLFKNNKRTRKRIHRIVAETFIPNPDNKPQVNHIDGNKTNNCVNNLEWCTESENITHAYKNELISGIKEIAQFSLDGKLIKIWKSAGEIQRILGINRATIHSACKESKTHYSNGFIWKYIMNFEDKQIVRMVGRNPDNPKSRIPGLPTEQRLELKEDGICRCLTNVQKDNMVMEKYRIRKLTPKESFRLMNFDDEDFYAAESVNSDSQLFKQAGNSIVVSCLCAIFSQLGIKGITPWNEMSEEQKKNLSAVNRCDNSGQERSPL